MLKGYAGGKLFSANDFTSGRIYSLQKISSINSSSHRCSDQLNRKIHSILLVPKSFSFITNFLSREDITNSTEVEGLGEI